MRVLLVVVMLGSCGRVGFERQASVDDAQDCALPAIEAPATPVDEFGPPSLLAALNSTAAEDDPTLTGDQLEIVFQSGRGGANRLWRSVRDSVDTPWPAPTPIVELDGLDANTPELSRDGLRLRYAAPGPGGMVDLFVVTRPDRESPWGKPVHVDGLATAQNETGSAEFLDGRAVVFFSDRPGGAPTGDLWESFDHGCAGFREATLLAGDLQSGQNKANPWMRDDGRAVVYAELGAIGSSDLFVATREEVGSPFGAPLLLSSVLSDSVDDDPWLDDEMRVLYFVSVRTGDVDLYIAER